MTQSKMRSTAQYNQIGVVTPTRSYKKNAMKQKKTFKQRIRDWLYSDGNDVESVPQDIESSGYSTDGSIRIDVTPARGGIIVSVRKYDPKTDRRQDIVHIIHDDQNISENIAHIISMELLRV